tara:strand:+ start:726 stop:1130 length:405 start_codon:yes stop_codon:yes gene_type:complete
MRWLLTLSVTVLALTTGTEAATTNKELIDAIHMVETSGRLGAIRGDGGAALGPLQIHRGCWQDANLPGRYEDCADLAYSKRVWSAYMARYATKRRLGRPVTDEDRARIWNGGPNGYKKTATIKYWAKVKKELAK